MDKRVVLNTWLRDTGALEPYLVITTTFVAAEISYRFVELPALRLKHHFETTKTTKRTDLPAVPALVGTGEAGVGEAGEGESDIGQKGLISR